MPRRRLLSAEPRAGAGRDERASSRHSSRRCRRLALLWGRAKEAPRSRRHELAPQRSEDLRHGTLRTAHPPCGKQLEQEGARSRLTAHHQGAARRLVKHTVWATVYGAGETGLACADSALTGLFLKSFFSFLCDGKRLSAVLSFVFFHYTLRIDFTEISTWESVAPEDVR